MVGILLSYVCFDLLGKSWISGVLEVFESLPHKFLLVINVLGLCQVLQELGRHLIHQLLCGLFEGAQLDLLLRWCLKLI